MIWKPATLPKLHPVVTKADVPQTYFLTVEEGGVVVRLQVWLDAREHAFRTVIGIGAVTTGAVLGALLSVSDGSLSPVTKQFEKLMRSTDLGSAATVIEAPDGELWAKSHIAAPLEIVDIEVQAPTWKRAFKAINEWAGYGPRWVRLPDSRKTDPLTLADASMYGIGVAFGTASEFDLEPMVFMPMRGSSGKWQVLEFLYRDLLETGLIRR